MSETSRSTPRPATALNALGAGAEAVISRISAHAEDLGRLRNLGFCVGQRVRVVRSGDPLIVEVMRARVGLASSLAPEMVVQPD